MRLPRWTVGLAALAVTGATVASASPASAADTVFQAEDAVISQGGVFTNHLNFTGTGFVDYTNVAGGYVQWSVPSPSAQAVTLVLRYANGTTVNRPMDITVNGTPV